MSRNMKPRKNRKPHFTPQERKKPRDPTMRKKKHRGK